VANAGIVVGEVGHDERALPDSGDDAVHDAADEVVTVDSER
jgi:hypothetical protein